MALVIKFLPARTMPPLTAFRPEEMQDLLPYIYSHDAPVFRSYIGYMFMLYKQQLARVLWSLRYLLQLQQKLLLYYTPM